MAKQQRQVSHSVMDKEGWTVVMDGGVKSRHASQAEAEEAAIEDGRAAYDGVGSVRLCCTRPMA